MTDEPLSLTLTEWSTYGPDNNDDLKGRSLDSTSTRTLADSLSRSSLLSVQELRTGLAIRTYSHVGRVQLGDISLTIIPKIDWSSLLGLLRYAYGFRSLRLFSASPQEVQCGGFEDLLISQLHAEATELVARGLHRAYIPRDERLASPRGRIDIRRLAGEGGIATASLPCIHHPRTEDCLLNRILLAGLKLASSLAADLQLRRATRRLAAAFEDNVEHIRLDGDVLQRANRKMSRLSAAYAPALSIIGLLHESKSISFAGEASPLHLPGFLFDMNRFFQALVARFLRDNLPDYSMREEYRLNRVMTYAPGYNPCQHPMPTPRPDFVLFKGAKVMAILDAKYRDLWERNLPREMLYQLAIYAGSNETKVATILYPTTSMAAKEARINVYDPVLGTQAAQVRLRPVIMQRLGPLLNGGQSAATEKQRIAYARWLAIGG